MASHYPAPLCPKCRSYNQGRNLTRDYQESDEWWCMKCGTIWKQDNARPWETRVITWGTLVVRPWPSWWERQKMVWSARLEHWIKYWSTR